MNGVVQPIHSKIALSHRWMANEVYSLTARQAGDRRRGYNTPLSNAAMVAQDIYCYDCGEKYVNYASTQSRCWSGQFR